MNICLKMITKIEKKLKIILLPFVIVKDAEEYWKRYFKSKYGINTNEEMQIFKNRWCLSKDMYNNLYD